jgi:hypothetical protein
MNSSKIIDALGGTTKVALIFGTSQGAVSQWRKNGFPSNRINWLELRKPSLFKKIKELIKCDT